MCKLPFFFVSFASLLMALPPAQAVEDANPMPAGIPVDVGFRASEMLASPDGKRVAVVGGKLGKMGPDQYGIQRAVVVQDEHGKTLLRISPDPDIKDKGEVYTRTQGAAAFSPDSQIIAWTNSNSDAAIGWHDFDTGKTHQLALKSFPPVPDSEPDPANDPDDGDSVTMPMSVTFIGPRQVAITWDERNGHLVDLSTDPPTIAPMPELDIDARYIAAIPGTGLVLISDNHKRLLLFDLAGKKRVRDFECGVAERLRGSPDGMYFSSIENGQGMIRETLTQLPVFEAADVRDIAFHVDGRHVLIAYTTGEVDLRDLATGHSATVVKLAVPTEGVGFAGKSAALACGLDMLEDEMKFEMRRTDLPKTAFGPTPITGKRTLSELWTALGEADVAASLVATLEMASAGDGAADFIKQKLNEMQVKPDPAAVAELIERQIARLGAPRFEDRENASEMLEMFDDAARGALQRAAAASPSVEARERAQAILHKIEQRQTIRLVNANELALARSIRVLRMVKTPAARETLDRIALLQQRIVSRLAAQAIVQSSSR